MAWADRPGWIRARGLIARRLRSVPAWLSCAATPAAFAGSDRCLRRERSVAVLRSHLRLQSYAHLCLPHSMTLDANQHAAAPHKPQRPDAGRSGRGRRRYSNRLAERVCRRLAEGASLRAIANDPEMPPRSTLRYWIKE